MSDAAHRIYVDALSWCGDMPDPTGFLAEAEARAFVLSRGKATKVIKELVDLGAWEKVGDGYLIHDFEKYLPKTSTDRVRTWRATKRNASVTVTQPEGNAIETVTHIKEGVSETPPARSTLAHARRVPVPEPVPEPVLKAPPTPSARTVALENGRTDDLGLQLAVRVAELLKRDLSAVEIQECASWIDDFAYLDVDLCLKRMAEYNDHRRLEGLDSIKHVKGYRETLRSQNDFLADHGSPKAWRPAPVVTSFHQVGDLLKPKEATS